MYMIMFSTLANSILYTMAGFLDVGYAIWWGSFVILGTAVGLKAVNSLVKKTGRTSYIAVLLTFIIILSAIVIPIFGGLQMMEKHDKGENILEFGSYCR
jgi:uncharacterized membrane protein YfcA